jgi:hypothetical protein
LRRRMYQEVNTGPVENLDVLERLIQVRCCERIGIDQTRVWVTCIKDPNESTNQPYMHTHIHTHVNRNATPSPGN